MIIKAMRFQTNIFHSFRNFRLATADPRARAIEDIASIYTYRRAAEGERMIVLKTIKVCVSVTPDGHEHVLSVRNCEIKGPEGGTIGAIGIIHRRISLVAMGTVPGRIGRDLYIVVFDGNVFNNNISIHRLACQVITSDGKTFI